MGIGFTWHAQLDGHRRQRGFDVTAEPEDKVAPQSRVRTARLVFAVRKHPPTLLHYDFRLEWRHPPHAAFLDV
jgi:hypothetical protein